MGDIREKVRQAMRKNGHGAKGDGRAAASAAPPWGELIPLASAPSALSFPLEVFPPALTQFAEEVAGSINCPVDYVGAPMLALAGAAIGASRALQIKPGFTERPCLYAAIVGPPSCGKTPALGFACRPFHDEQSRLFTIFRRERKAHEDGAEDAPKPAERTLFIKDFTCEKLAMLLEENPRGIAVIRDELTGWVRSMDQYRSGKGADRQFWLSAWSGDPISVHRKNQDAGPVRVAHPCVGVVGGLPPDLLAQMRGERALADGFIDRILFAYPDQLPARGESWRCVDGLCVDAWRDTIDRLWGLQPEADADRGPRPRLVRLTTCGRKAWERFTNDLADEMNGDSFAECLRGPWGKMRSYAARLGLIVHELRRVHDQATVEDVDGDSMDRAAALVRYFQAHARRVYAEMDADPKVADGRRVARWILENGLERFQKRDAFEATKGTFKTVDGMEPALMLLQKHGYIRIAPASDRAGPGRKPSPEFEVNPEALTT